MAALFWSGVAVSFQSALATSVAITGITKASPGVVSHGGTDPSDGDYVLIVADGMNQVNGRVFRVANAGVGSFELEGEDTTDYANFTNGTFQVVTFGNSLNTLTGVSPSGGEAEFEDETTIHDTIRKQSPTLFSALTYTFDSKLDVGSAGLAELKKASLVNGKRCFMFEFKDGSRFTLYGYVAYSQSPGGSAQGLVTAPVTVTADNFVVLYAS